MPTGNYPDLIARLSLPEKVELLTGATTFTLAPQPEIGLGELRMSDGPTGVRGLKFSGGRVVTLFPNATLLSAAWDPAGAYEVGRLLAEEAMIQELHVVLGPTINLHRSVLGGRLFEAYSEDPLLTGVLAAAYVRGLQDLGVAACLKHLIANESETDRNSMDSRLSEKTLRELYLLPFEIALAENPWSIMAAYNDVNGVAATEQVHVNTEIVKGEWGYDGLDHVRLVRHQDDRGLGQRRARPGDARSRGPLGRCAGRRRRGRGGRRDDDRRPSDPAAPAGRPGGRAR